MNDCFGGIIADEGTGFARCQLLNPNRGFVFQAWGCRSAAKATPGHWLWISSNAEGVVSIPESPVWKQSDQMNEWPQVWQAVRLPIRDLGPLSCWSQDGLGQEIFMAVHGGWARALEGRSHGCGEAILGFG